ncbi:hypothetical protein [Ornithinimicrobium kibberense]
MAGGAPAAAQQHGLRHHVDRRAGDQLSGTTETSRRSGSGHRLAAWRP